MSIDKNTAQRRMVTVCAEVLGSLRRSLKLRSAEGLSGIVQHHLVKHVFRLVQAEFSISLVTKEMF